MPVIDAALRKRIEAWDGGCDEYEHCDTKALCAQLIEALESAAPVAVAVEWLKDHADYAHYSCDGWEVICAGDERGYGDTLPAAVAALAKRRGE